MPLTLATLPSHILLLIAEHLPLEEVARLMLLNNHFHATLKDENYWKKAVERYFPMTDATYKYAPPTFIYLSCFDQYARLHEFYYKGVPNRRIQLFTAIRSRNLFYLKKIQLTFDELNSKDGFRNTLYDTIAYIGHQPTMNYIFSTIITPYYQDENGVSQTKKDTERHFTLLLHAAQLNQASTIHAYFEWAAATQTPRPRYEESFTPLHLAAKFGHLAAVKALLMHGEAVSTPDYSEDPLYFAAENGNAAIVKALLKHGANVNGTHTHYLPPIYYAALGGHLDAFNRCLQYGANLVLPPEYDEETTTTLLHCAVRGGNLRIVNRVIAMNLFNIDTPEKSPGQNEGMTPLHYAASYGHFSVFERLLAAGANPDFLNNNKVSLLHFAAQGMNADIVKATLSFKKVNINCTNKAGETPLHYAARYKKSCRTHNEIFDLLLEKGADIHAQAKKLQTPLHYAATNPDDTYALETLLEKGADANAVKKNYMTPLHCLTARTNPPRNSLVKINSLITHKADVNARDNIVWTESPPPSKAFPKTQKPTFHIISARTPLHLAALNQTTEVITALLNHGADLEARDGHGNTPLHCATERPLETSKDKPSNMVALLLEKGANANALNGHHETPRQYALRRGNNADLEDTFIAHQKMIEENAMLHAWCPGLFPPPQADHKRPSEEKGSSPKRQKPC